MSCLFTCFINTFLIDLLQLDLIHLKRLLTDFLVHVVDHSDNNMEGGEEGYQGGPSLY